MQTKKVARRLLTIGSIGLLYAAFMDTTVAVSEWGGRLTNLALLAKQQNVMFLSGLLVLIGAILYAAAISKSSKEDDATERAEQEAAKAARTRAIGDASTMTAQRLEASAGWLRRQFSRDRLARRIVVGVFVGLSLGALSTKAGAPWWLAAATCLAYAFRAGDAARATSHLLILNAAVFATYVAVQSYGYVGRDEVSALELSFYATLMFLPGLISIVAVLVDRRLRKT